MGNVKNTDYVANDIYGAHLRGDNAKFGSSNAVDRTSIIQRFYIRILTELSANRFEWKNLPPGIDERFLEMSLFYRSLVIFFKDENSVDDPGTDGYFLARGTSNGPWDVNDNPTAFTLFGNQFQSRILSAVRTYKQVGLEIVTNPEQCVPIWGNYLRVPEIDTVLIYSSRLAELDVTIEINSRNARRTKVVAVDENQRLTATNINRQIDQGETLIQIMPNAIGALPVAMDLGIDANVIEKLHILKVRQWNECMGYLGINNANQDKKERLVADEVDANNEQVAASRNVALNARQEACGLINKLYGLNVSVDFRAEEEAKNIDPEQDDTPDDDTGDSDKEDSE